MEAIDASNNRSTDFSSSICFNCFSRGIPIIFNKLFTLAKRISGAKSLSVSRSSPDWFIIMFVIAVKISAGGGYNYVEIRSNGQ